MTLLVMALAGAIGAVARHALSVFAQQRSKSTFPVGTLTVNLVGSALAGLVAGAGGVDTLMSLASLGFLGGFTTFSTWVVETTRLAVFDGLRPRAVVNLLMTMAAGIALAAGGHGLAVALIGTG
jgi:fluoride exporter